MKKILTLGIVTAGVIGVVAFGASQVFAVGGPQNGARLHDGNGQGKGRVASIESRAKALGVSVDELNKSLNEGKTMLDIAKIKGLDKEQFQTKMRDSAKARWEARGLSAEEVQERVDWQKNRQAECDGSGSHKNQGGYGRQNQTR